MRRKLRLKRLVIIFVVILFWKYISKKTEKNELSLRLGRLNNYYDILKNNASLDTYLHRIQTFLSESNISLLSYERMVVTDKNLLNKIETKINQLHQIQTDDLLTLRNSEQIEYACQKQCCWSKRKMKRFYSGENHQTPTYFDRLSQIDIKLLADLHYGNLPVPDNIKLPKLDYNILPCLQNNTIIFVDSPSLRLFFKNFHEKISVDYILITGDSDFSCPSYLARTHFKLLDKIFRGETRIIHWFSMNCNLGNNQQWKQSKLFSCIPQGINQWFSHRYYMQLAHGKHDSIYNIPLKTNDYWLFTSFNTNNGANYRRPLWDLSCYGRLKHLSKCFYQFNTIDQWRYYIHIARSKFVLSPPGGGFDCYRTWEALYLGSIPILINSPIDSIYENLPVLFIKAYEDLNLDYLENVYHNMTRQKYDYRRLYKGYWQEKIHQYRNFSQLIQIEYRTI